METKTKSSMKLASVIVLLATFVIPTLQIAPDAQQPAHFVLVHGLGHGAWCWYKVVTLLQQSGFQATALDMASGGRDQAIADEITSMSEFAKPLTDFLAYNTTGQVILVGHSLGGATISFAMEQFPTKITKAVFLAALMPPNGQSAASDVPPENLNGLLADGAVQTYAENASNPLQITSFALGPNFTSTVDHFYNKSPPEDITLAWALLKKTPASAVTEPLSLTAVNYGSIPRFYIETGQDHAFSPAVQLSVINNNPPKEVFTLNDSDHSAFFSEPEKLTGLLISISNDNSSTP